MADKKELIIRVGGENPILEALLNSDINIQHIIEVVDQEEEADE